MDDDHLYGVERWSPSPSSSKQYGNGSIRRNIGGLRCVPGKAWGADSPHHRMKSPVMPSQLLEGGLRCVPGKTWGADSPRGLRCVPWRRRGCGLASTTWRESGRSPKWLPSYQLEGGLRCVPWRRRVCGLASPLGENQEGLPSDAQLSAGRRLEVRPVEETGVRTRLTTWRESGRSPKWCPAISWKEAWGCVPWRRRGADSPHHLERIRKVSQVMPGLIPEGG